MQSIIDNDETPLNDSAFLRACRREKTDYTPIWLMRQAGRYQDWYRKLRETVSFLELCKRPELSAEVTVKAADQLGVDAAIIFADILLIVEPMGIGLTFHEGKGPCIAKPIRTGQAVDTLKEVEPHESLAFVFDAIWLTRQALPASVPLIGFCGAPFTVASYIIEGGKSRDFQNTKKFMRTDSGAWHALMNRLVRASSDYLNGQIDAGARAVQLFDSWVGCLNEAEYRTYALPHVQKLVRAVEPSIPVIYFGTNTGPLLKTIKETGATVIGLDWRMNLADAWAELRYDVAVQGNLDPNVLLTNPAEIRRQAHAILDQTAGRTGHIFNLGHGILPQTPVENAIALVEAVHEYKGNLRG